MSNQRPSLDGVLQPLPRNLNIEMRLAQYMAENVDRTFGNVQKSTHEIFEYLSIVKASEKYVNAVTKVESLMEMIRGLIEEHIDQCLTRERQRKRSPEPNKKIKITQKSKRTKQQNKKLTKTRKSKPVKMSTNQPNKDNDISIDKIDKTKFNVSILNPNTDIDKNTRRSQRVKYPPINEWAGEKLVQLANGSYALITSKRSAQPEFVLANKKIRKQLKKKPQKRLQTKLQAASSKKKSNKGRRTLYSPTRWMDSLTSNPDLFFANEPDQGNNSPIGE